MRRLLLLLALALPTARAQIVGETGEALDRFLTTQVEGGFSGAVLAAVDGEVILRQGYGFADRAAGLPNTPETVFQIGSVTKPLTATVVLALRDAGRLDVSDPIADYLDGVPADKAGLTIHQLLTHTAGLPDAIGDDVERIGREAYVRAALATPLDRAPGTGYAYSNVGYALLAVLVERVTGQSVDAVLQDLLRPLGITHTGYRLDPGTVARGYDGARDVGLPTDRPWADDGPYWNLRGNGGLLSTVDDLYRLHLALEAGDLLSDESRRLSVTPHTDEGPGSISHYGYGWALFPAPGGTLVTHNGGDGAWSADVLRFVDDGKVLIVFANSSDAEAFDVSGPLAQILFGRAPEPVRLPRIEPVPLDSLGATLRGRRALAFVETVNAGTEAAVRAFTEAHLDAAFRRNADGVVAFFEAVGDEVGHAPIALRGASWDGDESTLFLDAVRADGRGYRIHLGIHPGPDQRIEGMGTDDAEESGDAGCAPFEPGGSPVEAQAAALLAAVCDGSEAARRQFVAEHVAPSLIDRASADGLVEMLGRLHDDLGAAEVVGVELRSPTEGAFVVRPTGGGRPPLRLDLTVEAVPPHRLAGLGVDVAEAGPAFESLDDALGWAAAEAEAERFSGVVLVARAGEPVVHRAFGWADRQRDVRNALDTRFNLGSLNKVFTSVAILQLAEAGRIDLDAPIGTVLDGFPPEVAERVTVRHLLQHRSGWGHYWDHPTFLARHDSLTEIGDYLAFIRTIPLDFEPGARVQYSNVGFEVLGGIIEAVSGQRYRDYVRAHVFAPAGMTDTDAFTRPAPRLATPYAGGEGYDQPAADQLVARGTAAGGGYGTALDLLRFQTALAGGRLLRSASRNLLLSGFTSEADVVPAIGFAGGSPGVNGVWEWEGDASVIVLANRNPPAAERLGRALMAVIRAE